MTRMWDLDDLVSVGDIAAEYHTSKPAVSNWLHRYPDFPAPLITPTAGALYSRVQVRAWHTAWIRRHTERNPT